MEADRKSMVPEWVYQTLAAILIDENFMYCHLKGFRHVQANRAKGRIYYRLRNQTRGMVGWQELAFACGKKSHSGCIKVAKDYARDNGLVWPPEAAADASVRGVE